MNFCTVCGRARAGRARYCTGCGNPFPDAVSDDAASTEWPVPSPPGPPGPVADDQPDSLAAGPAAASAGPRPWPDGLGGGTSVPAFGPPRSFGSAEPTSPAESAGPAELARSAKLSSTAGAADPAGVLDPAEVADPAESADEAVALEPAETFNAADSAEPFEDAGSFWAAAPPEVTAPPGAAGPAWTAEPAESAGPSQPAGPAGPAQPAEQAWPAEPSPSFWSAPPETTRSFWTAEPGRPAGSFDATAYDATAFDATAFDEMAFGSAGDQDVGSYGQPPRRGGGRLGWVLVLLVLFALGVGGAVYLHHRNYTADTAQGKAARGASTERGQASSGATAAHTARGSASASTAPNSAAASSPGASGSLVTVTHDAAQNHAAHGVETFLNDYFTSINSRNYQEYRSLLDPALRQQETASNFFAGYASTTDSGAVLHSISSTGAGTVAAVVTFTSHQRPADSASGTACTRWSLTFGLAMQGGKFVFASVQSADRAC